MRINSLEEIFVKDLGIVNFVIREAELSDLNDIKIRN